MISRRKCGSYVAFWGHLSGANAAYEGLPTVSFLTARELAKFAGMRPHRVEIVADAVSPKDQVDVIAAVDAAGRTVRLAANWFLNDARVEAETIIAFGKDELPDGVTLHFAIRPMDDWGNRGNPIYVTR